MIDAFHQESSPVLKNRSGFFSWQVNLTVFGLLVTAVLLIFFIQVRLVNKDFRVNALERSRMVAGVIQENVHNGILASELLDKTITTFLIGTGNFAVYLESIEPFSGEELSAFASQAGLAGITVIRSGKVTSGPLDWFPGKLQCGKSFDLLKQDLTKGIAYTVLPLEDETEKPENCLIIGADISDILYLRQRTDLQNQIRNLAGLAGIAYVRIEDAVRDERVRLIENRDNPVAESSLKTSVGTLVVGINAQQYTQRVAQLRRQFFFFAAILILLGLFSSWLLYRFQKRELLRSREFERKLARQHEEAAMGRATATIAHEIRNPLNAIHMGLQRLRLESNNLDVDQKKLIAAMGEATKRTDSIITNLKRFTAPMHPDLQTTSPGMLLEQTIELYLPLCEEQSIAVEQDIDTQPVVEADPVLLGEVFDNLLKNAVEAQPDGGSITLRCHEKSDGVILEIINKGCTVTDADISKLTEPYFTTKTRGTGLGLALAKRIVTVHGGTLLLQKEGVDELLIRVLLPFSKS